MKVLVGWLVGAFNKRRSYEGPSLGTVKFQRVLLKTLTMESHLDFIHQGPHLILWIGVLSHILRQTCKRYFT